MPTTSIESLSNEHDTIPAYAKAAIGAVIQTEIVVNYLEPALLQSKAQATRAEAIAFIYQIVTNNQ